MTDPSPSSPDDGFTRFRAATALSRERPASPGAPRKAPPLPPPPPGAPSPTAASPAPAKRPASRTAPRPAVPDADTPLDVAWPVLLDWCRQCGLAEGGVVSAPGRALACAGDLGQAGADALVSAARGALFAARSACAATGVAVDLDGRWVTGFPVALPDGEALVVLRGKAPLRADLRAALGGWIAAALAAR